MNTYLWVALASLIGAVLAPRLDLPILSPILIIVALIAGITGFTEARGQASRREPAPPKPPPVNKGRQRKIDEILSLSTEQAQDRAESVFAAGKPWVAAPAAAGADSLPGTIPPLARAMFVKYDRVAALDTAACLSRDQIAIVDWPLKDLLTFGGQAQDQRCYRIGEDSEGNPVLIRPGSEKVYVVHNANAAPTRRWSSDYPSVYHFLLLEQIS